jgi:hypothetical protein
MNEFHSSDFLAEVLGWDVSFEKWQERLHAIRMGTLIKPVNAFAFNLKSIDNLLLSPFLIAADGVHLFYWTLST